LDLLELDDGLDAAIVCTVGRRASVAQGRALLGVWERSLLPSLPYNIKSGHGESIAVLKEMSTLVRKAPSEEGLPYTSAHLPPLFGALCALLGLTLEQTAYVYLLSHVKALLSAAVRASIFGPYQAQRVLASEGVQAGNWDVKWEEAGQVVPVLDLWVGRHEILYSRIFNS
jgi:urease accessory protein